MSSYSRLVLATAMCLQLASSDVRANSGAPKFDASITKSNVESMDCIVRHRYSAAIERHIKGFVVFTRNNTQRILGHSTMYFPTIERVLKEEGVPDDLKYLTIVESMLDPKAVSSVGARGMWQLMPFIAEEFELDVDGLIDERSHVERSTRAGAQFLKKLYEQFGNWELALAAYNCGASRVRKTLKAANKKTYWGIRPYLPKQTQGFVPKFIAIKYLFTHYQEHELIPVFPKLDMQMTSRVRIHRGHSLRDIANITGLTEGEIALLNPSLKFNTDVYKFRELDIVLPTRVINAYRQYLDTSDDYFVRSMTLKGDGSNYYKVVYTVDQAQSLASFCDQYGLSHNQVWMWNELSSDELYSGQEIFIYDYQPLHHALDVEDYVPMDASIVAARDMDLAIG